MGRSKWILLLLIPMLFGFDTRNPLRTRGPFKAYDFIVGQASGSCVDGSTCFCDRIRTIGDPIYVSDTVYMCEDFETNDYYLNTANSIIAGTGSGVNHNRGANSTWYANYGQPAFDGYFKSSDPAPTLGSACGSSIGSCAGVLTYCSETQGDAILGSGTNIDCWGPGTNDKAQVWFQRTGEFDEEVTDLTLTGGHGSTSDIGAGNTHMAVRVPRGGAFFDSDNGAGQKNFANSSTIGFMMLSAHSSNIIDSGIISSGAPWKFEEWRPGGDDQPFMGMIGIGGAGNNTFFPYQPFFWVTSSANCKNYIHTATAHVGSIGCLDLSAQMGVTADGSVFPNWAVTEFEESNVTAYNQAADWPWGEWACTRAYISGMGTSSMELKVWHNDVLVIHISGLDTTAMVSDYYNAFWFNAYSNLANDTGLSEVAYRYRDNILITNNVPPTCDSLGYLN